MREGILLVPIGPVSADLLAWLAERLGAIVRDGVTIGEEIPLPEGSYDPQRRQYQGDALLARLRALPSVTAGRVLGLADADCTTQGLNFIFGQAAIDGREAFVALPRLRPSFYGQPRSRELFRQRVVKEAVHELGHTWGLSHCPNPRCVMYFSNTLHDTDTKGVDFCSDCQDQMKGIGEKSLNVGQPPPSGDLSSARSG
ncbi:MAG: archaemetzincin family Zn-dependent metalloprotease [Anaerolineae bacterium]|jgi:archaemetzincin